MFASSWLIYLNSKTIRFFTSVYTSVRMEQLGSHWEDFRLR
jgi:hypothetical protein